MLVPRARARVFQAPLWDGYFSGRMRDAVPPRVSVQEQQQQQQQQQQHANLDLDLD